MSIVVATESIQLLHEPDLFSARNNRIPTWIKRHYYRLALVVDTKGLITGTRHIATDLGISQTTAMELISWLKRLKLLVVLEPGRGRRPAKYQLRRFFVKKLKAKPFLNGDPYKELKKNLRLKQQQAVDGQSNPAGLIQSPSHARYAIFHLRKAVNGTDLNQQQRETLISQLAKWVWRKMVTVRQLREIHNWLISLRNKSVGFTGRSLVRWMCRQLKAVMQWRHKREHERKFQQEQRSWKAAEQESKVAFNALSSTKKHEVSLLAWASAREVLYGPLMAVGFSRTQFHGVG